MRKFALIFVLAVFLPSVVLGWLALDSLRNQEYVFERQQELLLQGTSDTLAERIRGFLGEKLIEFGNQVEQLANGTEVVGFDEGIRKIWPAATVGFVVTMDGKLIAPSAKGSAPAARFLAANSRFLTNAESAEVYQQPSQPAPQSPVTNNEPVSQRSPKSEVAKPSQGKQQRKDEGADGHVVQPKAKSIESAESTGQAAGAATPLPAEGSQRMIPRSVNPQKELKQTDTSLSNVLPAEAEFHQLIGTAMSGSVARFVGNELFVIFWHRTTSNPALIFGAAVNLSWFTKDFDRLIQPDYDLSKMVCVALLDDRGKPVVTTPPGFATNWI